MKISPLAGKPAPPGILVDVPRLVSAYYTDVPDPAVPGQRVAFGTSGHRGSSFKLAFNEWHILAITQAICLYRKRQNISGPLYLGMDTHALSVPACATALEVLAANGVEVMLAEGDEYTPTPVISHAILTYNRGRKQGLADGIVITPSHNPPHDGGFKYNPPNGGPADNAVTAWIEAKANALLEVHLKGVKRIPHAQALRAATTHRHDYLTAYVNDLGNVIDMNIIRSAKIHLGVDPLGGAGVHYWARIAEQHGLNLTVVDETVDPTFRFMTVDWDGQIRMDPSSTYAMQRLIGMKDHFDLSFACDTDHDRHGIVTKSDGLLPPNHDLCVAIFYLFQNRPKWSKSAAVGKTIVSSQMIDRITAKAWPEALTRCRLVSSGSWMACSMVRWDLAARKAQARFSFVWMAPSGQRTRTDSFPVCSLRRSPREWATIPAKFIANSRTSSVSLPMTGLMPQPRRNKRSGWRNFHPQQVKLTELAGEKIQTILTHAPGNDAPIGGLKVMAESGWFAARPSGTENIYKIYAESFQGEEHLHRILEEAQTIINAALAASPPKPVIPSKPKRKKKP